MRPKRKRVKRQKRIKKPVKERMSFSRLCECGRILCVDCWAVMHSTGEKVNDGKGEWIFYSCPFCKRESKGYFAKLEMPPLQSEIEPALLQKAEMSQDKIERLKNLRKRARLFFTPRKITGMIGEITFMTSLRNDGFKVTRTTAYIEEGKISVLNETGIEEILENNPRKKELLKILKSLGVRGLPDIICEKDGKILFYEIKTNNSEIKDYQQKYLKRLTAEGYPAEVKRLWINYKVSETEEGLNDASGSGDDSKTVTGRETTKSDSRESENKKQSKPTVSLSDFTKRSD